VQVVERWILARLRNQRFFSLAELNAAIRELLDALNGRPMRRLGVSHRQLFDELDRPALAALPVEPYVYAEWRQRRVGLDYHVDVDGHYYSVPHRLLRQQVEARITQRIVELFHQERACRLPSAGRRPRPSYHRERAHAELASPSRRLDTRAHPTRSHRHRAGHRHPGRGHPAQPAPSRARLPRLPRHPAARSLLRRRPPRGDEWAVQGARFITLESIAHRLYDGVITSSAIALPARHDRASS
jgi:hypothetical protein